MLQLQPSIERGEGYDSNNLPTIIAVNDAATTSSGLSLSSLFTENISLGATDTHYDSQISSIINSIGNQFQNPNSSLYTKNQYDSIGNSHIMGFEGIVNLIYLSNISCTIRKRRNTGFLDTVKFGDSTTTINSNVDLDFNTLLNE